MRKQFQTLAPLIIAIVALIVALVGAARVEAQLEGVSNFNGIHLDQSTFGTATPQFEVHNQGNNQSLRILDSGGTPEVYIDADGGMTVNDFTATSGGNLDLNGNSLILDANANTSLTADTDDQLDFEIGGADELALTAASFDFNDTFIDQDIGTENLMLPTVASQAFTYTAAAGGTVALFTIADGEIWLIHDIYINITTNWDATGDDAVVVIGDGGDPNGLCDFTDGELQTTDVEVTGAPAGWQCFASTDVIGAYITSGRGFIYAPSGSAETIDAVISASGDDLSAGAATAYIVYTRIQ